jgi:hypothetical protein
MHCTVTRLPPSRFVTVPSTSRSFLLGVLTLVTGSLGAGPLFLPKELPGLFKVSQSPLRATGAFVFR